MTDVDEITPGSLRAELTRLGYVLQDDEGRSGETWIDPQNDENPAVLVPREEERRVRGYSDLVQSALERLTWITGRDLRDIVSELRRRGDEFELRILHATTAHGRLPILRAPDVVDGFLQVIRAGARAEFRGTRPSYLGSDPGEVTAALEAIELLPPAAGSFRLVAVAVEAQLPLPSTTAPPAKSRRAVAATMRALTAAAAVSDATTIDDPDDLLGAVDEGLSTTLLAGLEAIGAGIPDATIEFSTRWDPAFPDPQMRQSAVQLRGDQLIRVPRLLELLRYHEPQADVQISGWVKTVSADALHPEGQPTGYVIVEVRRAGRRRDVRIELPHAAFAEVRAGVSWLNARGVLERISGRWHLSAPTRISIGNPPPDATTDT